MRPARRGEICARSSRAASTTLWSPIRTGPRSLSISRVCAKRRICWKATTKRSSASTPAIRPTAISRWSDSAAGAPSNNGSTAASAMAVRISGRSMRSPAWDVNASASPITASIHRPKAPRTRSAAPTPARTVASPDERRVIRRTVLSPTVSGRRLGYLRCMPDAATILSDRYELGPELGHGGMARVLRGTDRQLGRHVAIKVLSPPYDRDQAFVERFRREAHAAARLNHPSIVAVYDTGSDDGTHYIVTELVEGETLAELFGRGGPLPPQRAVDISTEITRALVAAHERGVVHRDVKPGNVMLTPDGRVKVVDFGIARAAGVESVTRSGLVLGSAPYISPEQARGEPGDERSDIYALGCVMYEMLTGRPPFNADTPVATLYLHVHEQVPPPSSVGQVPENLEPTAPVKRIRPSSVSRRRPRDRRWWFGGGLAALVLLVTWAAFAFSD